jgi:hypothetical protein
LTPPASGLTFREMGLPSLLRRQVVRAGALAVCLALTGCLYHFSGGGLPSDVRTVAVLPFENETATPELQRELNEALRKAFSSRLGLREAAEDKASAVVRGTITRYEIDVPIAFSANPQQATSARRRLLVVIDVEIFDTLRNKTLWQKKGMQAEGEYTENAEASGRKQAVDRIVNDVIEGAQSQW